MEEIQDLRKLLIGKTIRTVFSGEETIISIDTNPDGYLEYCVTINDSNYFFEKSFTDLYLKNNSIYFLNNTPVLLTLEETAPTLGFYVQLEPI